MTQSLSARTLTKDPKKLKKLQEEALKARRDSLKTPFKQISKAWKARSEAKDISQVTRYEGVLQNLLKIQNPNDFQKNQIANLQGMIGDLNTKIAKHSPEYMRNKLKPEGVLPNDDAHQIKVSEQVEKINRSATANSQDQGIGNIGQGFQGTDGPPNWKFDGKEWTRETGLGIGEKINNEVKGVTPSSTAAEAAQLKIEDNAKKVLAGSQLGGRMTPQKRAALKALGAEGNLRTAEIVQTFDPKKLKNKKVNKPGKK